MECEWECEFLSVGRLIENGVWVRVCAFECGKIEKIVKIERVVTVLK